jgi:hypothetical protein
LLYCLYRASLATFSDRLLGMCVLVSDKDWCECVCWWVTGVVGNVCVGEWQGLEGIVCWWVTGIVCVGEWQALVGLCVLVSDRDCVCWWVTGIGGNVCVGEWQRLVGMCVLLSDKDWRECVCCWVTGIVCWWVTGIGGNACVGEWQGLVGLCVLVSGRNLEGDSRWSYISTISFDMWPDRVTLQTLRLMWIVFINPARTAQKTSVRPFTHKLCNISMCPFILWKAPPWGEPQERPKHVAVFCVCGVCVCVCVFVCVQHLHTLMYIFRI